ncbi:MAG TPA: TonB-dependent receptor, partial [Chitinophagaceae bacterium]|nr:TonB-dependent receptor [Chitinophagaceae bacterium]
NRTYNEFTYPNQTDNYQQQYYQLFADHKFNSRWSVGSAFFLTRGQGYYEEYKSDARYSNYLLAPVVHGSDTLWKTDLIRQLWLDNDFYGMRLYSHYVSAKTDAALYVNLNQYAGRHFGKVIWTQQGGVPDQYEWYRLTANKQDQNIYAMVDHRFRNRWSLYADLQYRHVNYQLNGFRNNPTLKHELEYHFMNPKLKLSFQDDIQLLSLLAGISQKEPNRDDVEAGAGSLPKAEKLLDIELNYSRSFWRQFMVHANVFYMMYQDQLVLNGKINDIGAYTRVNVDRSFRRGIEVELLWKAIPRWIDVSANVALSQNIIPGFVSYTDDYDQGIQIEKTYSNTPISFSPGLIASDKIQLYPFTFFYNSRFRPWAFVLQAKYVGKQYLDNTGSADRMLKAYSVFDMGVHCPIAWRGRTLLTLKATLYNFLNHLYEANGYTYGYIENQTLQTYNYYFPQAGRRWMLGVNLNL